MITDFESELPLESVRSLINQIRTRDVDRYQFGLDLLNVQSYAMGRVLSGPMMVGSAPSHDPSDEEALSALNTLEHADEFGKPDELPAAGPVNAAAMLVLKWALKRFLKEYI